MLSRLKWLNSKELGDNSGSLLESVFYRYQSPGHSQNRVRSPPLCSTPDSLYNQQNKTKSEINEISALFSLTANKDILKIWVGHVTTFLLRNRQQLLACNHCTLSVSNPQRIFCYLNRYSRTRHHNPFVKTKSEQVWSGNGAEACPPALWLESTGRD